MRIATPCHTSPEFTLRELPRTKEAVVSWSVRHRIHRLCSTLVVSSYAVCLPNACWVFGKPIEPVSFQESRPDAYGLFAHDSCIPVVADTVGHRGPLPIMARANGAPTNIGELIDQLERIREELRAIQHSMEKMEPAPSTDSHDKKAKMGL
jgi:hypothetical protein